MSVKYEWENGNVKVVDPSKDQIAKDQITGQQQLQFDNDPAEQSVQPPGDNKHPIVDENGQPAPSEHDLTKLEEEDSGSALDLIKGGKFNAKLFHEQYEDNTEKVLFELLSKQSNENPLKKGGDSIAFRCSAIILQNRQNYTVPQNTLLDIITARMSSRPEDTYYVITAKELIDELPYTDKSYIYKIMSETCKELNRSPFIFEIDLANGKKKTLEFQWNEVLMYNGSSNLDTNEDAYISFTPTKFFRILTLSSTIMHGAHYSIGVAASIQSKYARNLFYYLEGMKNYREYPGATPGQFTLSLEDFQYIIKYPSSYRTADIRRFVLDKTVEEINYAKGVDFSFTYEFIKTSGQGRKKKITHVRFMILKNYEDKIQKQETPSLPEPEQSTVNQLSTESDQVAAMQVLKGVGLSESECNDVLRKYILNKRDLTFLTQAITSLVTSKDVKSKCALLCHIMDNGLSDSFSYEENQKRNFKIGNSISTAEKRDYDINELENLLLNSKPSNH